jgi:hypothetical protein
VPFNGSGTYSFPVNSFNPAVAATTINPTDWNSTATDLATALSSVITKDGQTTTSARIPFSNGISADTVTEFTSAAGVTADGTLLKDGNIVLADSTDNTKKATFALSGITTATTRTLTVPNASGTIALTSGVVSSIADDTNGGLNFSAATGAVVAKLQPSDLATKASPTTSDLLMIADAAASNVAKTSTIAQVLALATASIGSVAIQAFTGNGTYTPTAGMKYCVAFLTGGGGGGNSVSATTPGAGGGGAGATGIAVFNAATIGASQAVTIGAGGTVTNAGGNSSLGALLTANGGSAGGASASLSGGAGGAGSNTTTGATLSIAGGYGDAGGSGDGGGGAYGSGGSGGASFWGSGGAGGRQAATAGIAGVTYGSGGGGAGGNSGTGASGAAGVLFVIEFI